MGWPRLIVDFITGDPVGVDSSNQLKVKHAEDINTVISKPFGQLSLSAFMEKTLTDCACTKAVSVVSNDTETITLYSVDDVVLKIVEITYNASGWEYEELPVFLTTQDGDTLTTQDGTEIIL